MFRAIVVGFTCLLVASTAATRARADELGPGEKGVRLLLRVEAEVPAASRLILVNTFRGADVVTPGQEMQISWHPARGDLQLAAVSASAAAELPALQERFDLDAIGAITGASLRCGGAFAGIRTLPDTSPASAVRWTFRVGFTGPACKAEKIGVEYLDGSGQAVDPGQAVREPPITPPQLAAASGQPAKTEAAKAADAKAADAKAADAKADPASPPATSGGCDLGGSTGGLAALVLLGLRRRRTA